MFQSQSICFHTGLKRSPVDWLLSFLCLKLGKMIPSYFLFILGVLLKPQTLIFAPLILMGIFEHVFLKDLAGRNFFKTFWAVAYPYLPLLF